MNPQFAAFHLFPPSASTLSADVDLLSGCLLALSGMIVGLVFLLMIGFGIRYRAGSRADRTGASSNHDLLELGWMVAPLGLSIGLFVWGAILYLRMHEPPGNAAEISVLGKQWMWQFEHPNGRREINELHVPVGKPIKLVMASQDVIHSFFVPAFRLKQDVVPGRYSTLWFQATKPGEYHLFCSQFCGTAHAQMTGKIIVLSENNYAEWETSGLIPRRSSLAARGERLFSSFGCVHCHEKPTSVHAPDLAGLYGSRVELADGTTVIADENYLREYIMTPNTKKLKGFQPIMPSFQGMIGEQDLLDLIAYLKAKESEP